MGYLRQAIGVVLVAHGSMIIIGYWIYWARVMAQAMGFGRVGFVSMAPFAGPALISLGALLFGEPLLGLIGWWVLLVDLNTYNLVVSAPLAIWFNIKESSRR